MTFSVLYAVSGAVTFAVGQAPAHRNVILFVADGLRRGSVTPEDMPTLYKLRTEGVDFRNSHSVFPTFTTANASVIATGHGLGDTGDYSNVIYPGIWLTRPDPLAVNGFLTPFLENDEILADMNAAFHGNYLGERTLLSVAAEKGFNVAAIGKIGPTAIQLNDRLGWSDDGFLTAHGAVIIDDTTGTPAGVPLPQPVLDGMNKAGIYPEAPSRSNGYSDTAQANNGFSGDAATPGTLAANHVQQQWMNDVATKVLLPGFAVQDKPFVMLFWSRDPDATQHNQGDSLQNLTPGINGDSSKAALRNADHSLKALLDWLDANPKIKANTDVLITSDHGFATISRRDIAPGTMTGEPSAFLPYETGPKDRPQPSGTLPSGFLAVDLGIRMHMRVFDPAVRSTTGSSPFAEVTLNGEKAHHPSTGSALLGDNVARMDAADAKLVIASNGGSDLIYVPSRDTATVRATIATLTGLDYVGGVFADDSFCATLTDCPGALPLSAIGLVGHSAVIRPAIVVTYKVFYQKPGDLQSAAQVSDTALQHGQGMHGGFGREQTLNNMAAIGPDFKTRFVDEDPMGNIDIVPTVAHILGFEMPATGSLKGRILTEALSKGPAAKAEAPKTLASAPVSGLSTVLDYQEKDGVRYYDRACMAAAGKTCP